MWKNILVYSLKLNVWLIGMESSLSHQCTSTSLPHAVDEYDKKTLEDLTGLLFYFFIFDYFEVYLHHLLP
jgi:hypothetical protein